MVNYHTGLVTNIARAIALFHPKIIACGSPFVFWASNLVAAETTDIEPVILFNKSDLINEANKEFIHGLIDTYKELGYEVLLTSANDQASCATELSEWLANHISVFVGQSGVGKSSLIRSILGDQTIRVGDLSENTRKGTHTTTTAKLFHLPSGGQLVDSPGIREFGLWHISAML